MGAVNYGSSDYITLGIELYDFDDVKQGYIDFLIDEGMEPDDAENAATDQTVYDEIEEYYSCDRENAESIIRKYNPYNYHVSVKSGYYEGLYIDIENNYPVCFDDYKEKRDAQKEITNIKNMLLELAGCGFIQVYPGWITTYKDYQETKKAINEAIKDMRTEARTTPTWRDYNADRHYKTF